MATHCVRPHLGAAPAPGRVRRVSPITLLVAGLTVALAGCFTGARPSFEDPVSQDLTGRVEIDHVLVRLDSASESRFTATYDILTRLGNRRSTATVVQADESRRSITINDVRYLFDGTSVATCMLGQGSCVDQITPQATYGELFVDQDFYATTPATRLRNDARTRIAEPTSSEIERAGRSALCVNIPVSGGTNRYCALQSGVLALYEGNDLLVEMTRYTDEPDDALFARD